MARPRLFIGSSKESLDYAYAIQENLDDDAEATVWTQGIFHLTKTAVENLVRALENTDLAVFVFAPDDALRLRKKTYASVRDNVVFELGLFMGKLGPQRTFIVVPKANEDLRIPTDLAGITPGVFDSKRGDKNLRAALGPFCNVVRGQIRRRRTKILSKPRQNARSGSRPKGDLLVIEAAYGIENHRVDVRTQLNATIVDSKIHTYVGNQFAGDPCPNSPKHLIVKYRYKNEVLTRTIPEGATLDLP